MLVQYSTGCPFSQLCNTVKTVYNGSVFSMSTTRKIAHNTAVQIVGKALSTVLGFVAFLLMARYLGAEQFGWYGTTVSVLGFAGILIDFGLIPVTAQMMSEPRFDKTRLFRTLFTLRLLSAIVFFGLVAGLIFLPQIPYPWEVKIAISFSTISFIAVSLNQVLIGFYQTRLRMHMQAIGEVVGRIVLLVGLWLLITEQAGFVAIMWLVVLSSVAYTAVLLVGARKENVLGFALDADIVKAIAIKSWPLAVAVMFNVVYLKGDVLILSVVRSQVDVGVYTAAYRVVDILAQLAMMIMGIMLPLMAYAWSRENMAEFRTRYQQSFDLMMLLGLPVSVGVLLTAPRISPLFGEELIPAAVPLAILAIAVFGVYLGAVFGHAVVAVGKQKQAMWVYLSNAILTLAGYLIFIPRFGMLGAAWMTVFSEIYAGVLLLLMVRHYAGVPLTMSTCTKIILSTILMTIPVVLLPTLNIFAMVAIAGVVYVAALVLTRTISGQTLKEIFSV